jgi:hypothetical protein
VGDKEVIGLVLTKLGEVIVLSGQSPEKMAKKSKGDFSGMTVRRALKGRGVDRLKAKAMARVLNCKLEDLL